MASLTAAAVRDQARQSIDDHIKVLCDAVQRERASDAFRAYLDTQARFHNYSWHNTLLILSQRPKATRVAGYRTWQKLGRQVRKGERGIRIFAPCAFKRENVETGETESGLYFRMVSVFDVGQTDGDALPTVDVPTIDEAADGMLAHLLCVAETRRITVEFKALDGPLGSSFKGRIEIEAGGATGQQAETLAHELAHEALHWEDRGRLTRTIAELEAESVAYVVSKHFGLECELAAARYIALWSGDEKGIRESLKRIADTAKGIIDGTADDKARRADAGKAAAA